MKKLIYLICTSVMLLFASSCLTPKRIERNCDQFAKICITEKETVTIVRDTTIYRTDTVLVQLPRDTVTLTDTVKIVNNKAFLPPVHKQFGIVGVDAWVNFSVLNVRGYLTDSTLLYNETDTVFLKGAVQTQTVTNTVPVKYIPGFYKFTFWLFWIVVGSIVLIITWWVLRNFTNVFKIFAIGLFLSGGATSVKAQSPEFVQEFDGNTKQTILITFDNVENPDFHAGLFLVVDTIYKVYTAPTSGQYYRLRDSTAQYSRQYLGWKTNNRFEEMTVFSDKNKTRFWVWKINDRGELEKSEAPEWLYQ